MLPQHPAPVGALPVLGSAASCLDLNSSFTTLGAGWPLAIILCVHVLTWRAGRTPAISLGVTDGVEECLQCAKPG